MAQAAKKPITNARGEAPRPAFIDPATIPDLYRLVVAGDCMSPPIKEGDYVTGDRTAEVKKGDDVILFFKNGVHTAHGSNVWLKRVVMNTMPGLKLPFEPHPQSEVIPVLIVEQLNPPQRYRIDVRSLLAVHKCVETIPVKPSRR